MEIELLRVRTALAAILLYLIVVTAALGMQIPTGQSQIRHFTDENGLPQNSINGMGMDNAGFVWIATHGGLVRFDGRKLTTYTKQMLSVDGDRFIRMGLNPRTGIMYAVNETSRVISLQNGSPVEERYAMERAVEHESIAPSWTSGIPIDTTYTADGYSKYSIIPGYPGSYFVYANQKVMFFHGGRITKTIDFPGTPYFKPFPGEPSVRKTDILKTKGLICIDNFFAIRGNLFYHIGNEGAEFYRISENEGITKTGLQGDVLRNPGFSNQKQTIRIIANPQNGQAFAILGNHIYHITYPERQKGLQTTLLTDDFNIDDNLVSRLLYDEKNRTLFLGSFSQGLMTIRQKVFRVITNPEEENFHNVYYSHLPFSAASVIIPSGAILGNYKRTPQDGLAFREGSPTGRSSMQKDEKGRYWIFKAEGLYRLSPNASTVEAYWPLAEIPERMYHTSDGYIWIGFRNGGVARLSSNAGSSEKPAEIVRLNSTVTFLYQDNPGQLWLGTSGGLFLYKEPRKIIYPVKGLARKHIRSIYSPKPNELWITTYGDGIFLLKENKLFPIPSDKNGYLRHAHDIVADEHGSFWIPTNKGLFRASREGLLAYTEGRLSEPFYMYYNKDDGLLSNEFNGGCQPCGVQMPDGHYSLPSMNGLVWFKPGEVPAPYLDAPMFFENLHIDDQPRVIKDSIQLRHNFSHLTFEVATAFTGIADNLKIQYTIEEDGEKSAKWSALSQDQRVDVYGLAPGSYTLVVRKTTGFNGKNIEKRLFLEVAQAWYFSWWFAVLVIAGIVAFVWLFTKWRLRSLVRQNALLSQKVEERTGHLSKALDDLRASDNALQTQLQIQMRIIGVINHDLHSPLRYLSNQVPRFLEQVTPCMTDRDTVGLGSAISKSTLKVYQLTDDLLRFVKSTYDKKGEITYEEVRLKTVLDQKAVFFADIARENQTTLTVECDRRLSIKTNPMMLEILIHNLLDNALKHTYSQSVWLTARRNKMQGVTLLVRDTGYGMPPEIVEWLNDTGENGEVHVPGNLGLGLIIVKEITKLLSIRLAASSSQEGTTISLHADES